MSTGSRRAFTVVELLVTLGVTGLLCALMLPAVQSSREKSQAIQCRHRLRQLSLALQNHEATHLTFPRGGDMVHDGTGGQMPRSHSPHVYLLPFLDQADVFNQIDRRIATERDMLIIAGVNDGNESIKRRKIPMFMCPTEVQAGRFALNSYRVNLGVSAGPHSVWQTSAFGRGSFFPPQRNSTAADFGDGLSQTVAFSERVAGDGNSSVYSPSTDWWQAGYRFGGINLGQMTQAQIDAWYATECASLSNVAPPHASDLGAHWFYAGLMDTWYNHALTPNHHVPDCGVPGGLMATGVMTARSRHAGGVHAAFMDGSARFVADRVDERVWQAWASRNGSEVVASE